MAATGLQLNVSSVTFSAATVTHITSCNFDEGKEISEYIGDNSRYPQIIANTNNKPKFTLTGGDIAAFYSLSSSAGALVITLADALAQTAGSIVWTMANAVKDTYSFQQPHGQFGTATIAFRTYSPDGTTNPIVMTRV